MEKYTTDEWARARDDDIQALRDCADVLADPNATLESTRAQLAEMEWRLSYLMDRAKFAMEVTDRVLDNYERHQTDDGMRARHAEWVAQKAAAAVEAEKHACVYYLRVNGHINIGFTTNLKGRMASYQIDRECLLAVEPGGRQREQQRHREFSEARIARTERFHPVPGLLAHIALTRRTFGDPLTHLVTS